jgi:hypothetical protein
MESNMQRISTTARRMAKRITKRMAKRIVKKTASVFHERTVLGAIRSSDVLLQLTNSHLLVA